MCFLHIFVHLDEESVIVEGLFINASTRRVNFMSFSEASSSSSCNGACSLRLSLLLLLGLFFLWLRLLLEELEVGTELDSTGGVGKPRNGGEYPLCKG
jgi:hypothetical protein